MPYANKYNANIANYVHHMNQAHIRTGNAIKNKLRNRMSRAHAVAVPKVSAQDLKEIEHH